MAGSGGFRGGRFGRHSRLMHRFKSLHAAVANAPVRELRATLVRRVPLLPILELGALDFLFTSGRAYRYNPAGVRCVYFSEDEATAAAEYQRHNPGRRQPFVTYFAKVSLRRVIDLCSRETLESLGLAARDLRVPWVGARHPTVTQLLGKAVSSHASVAAIRFPSEAARTAGFAGANLVVFQDSIRRPDSVHILGPTKAPLQKWP